LSRGVSEWGGAVIATGGAVRRADKAVRQTANSERAGGDVCEVRGSPIPSAD